MNLPPIPKSDGHLKPKCRGLTFCRMNGMYMHDNEGLGMDDIYLFPLQQAATSAAASAQNIAATYYREAARDGTFQRAYENDAHSALIPIFEGDEEVASGKATTTSDFPFDIMSPRTDRPGGLGLPTSLVRVDGPAMLTLLYGVAPLASAAASNMVEGVSQSVHAEATRIVKSDDERAWLSSVFQSAYSAARQAHERYHACKRLIANHCSRGHHRLGRRIRFKDLRVHPMDGGSGVKSKSLQDRHPSVLCTWGLACDDALGDILGFDEPRRHDIENGADGCLGRGGVLPPLRDGALNISLPLPPHRKARQYDRGTGGRIDGVAHRTGSAAAAAPPAASAVGQLEVVADGGVSAPPSLTHYTTFHSTTSMRCRRTSTRCRSACSGSSSSTSAFTDVKKALRELRRIHQIAPF
mmetsp:Transcript_34999/g.71411  ORF Transcript_34999/g.71411 Transcript_34999/m.71411 type:complete len:411 (-) Transcript_34999:16-1248(-)